MGRRDRVIQWVDRADRPKPKVLVGRRAAIYKELVTRGAVCEHQAGAQDPRRAALAVGRAPIAEAVAERRTA